MRILDIGGGTGAYSFLLANLGHKVSFVDPSEAQVASVRAKNKQSESKLISTKEGFAHSIDAPEDSFDIVLNMGPMYHLPPGEERIRALQEMRRLLSDEGLLFSAYISRLAALMDGYKKCWIANPEYEMLSLGDLKHGIHDGPDDDKYFTLAYMHRPAEVASELASGGFEMVDLLAVEGFFWTYPHLEDFVDDEEAFIRLLFHAQLIEKESSLMGASAHFLSVARKNLN